MITKSSRARLKAFSFVGLAKECLKALVYTSVAAAGAVVVLALVWAVEDLVQ